MREKSIKKGRTTHLTWYSIVRVSISTLVYIMVSLSSYLPALIIQPNDPLFPYEHNNVTLNMDITSPYLNTMLCDATYHDQRLGYYSSMRCPTATSFLPCVVGIGFFIMYGFGKHARRTYAVTYDKLVRYFGSLG